MSEMKNIIKSKVEEITFAEYSGDIKGMVCVIVDKDNQIRVIEATDSQIGVIVYTGLAIASRRIENAIMASMEETPYKE